MRPGISDRGRAPWTCRFGSLGSVRVPAGPIRWISARGQSRASWPTKSRSIHSPPQRPDVDHRRCAPRERRCSRAARGEELSVDGVRQELDHASAPLRELVAEQPGARDEVVGRLEEARLGRLVVPAGAEASIPRIDGVVDDRTQRRLREPAQAWVRGLEQNQVGRAAEIGPRVVDVTRVHSGHLGPAEARPREDRQGPAPLDREAPVVELGGDLRGTAAAARIFWRDQGQNSSDVLGFVGSVLEGRRAESPLGEEPVEAAFPQPGRSGRAVAPRIEESVHGGVHRRGAVPRTLQTVGHPFRRRHVPAHPPAPVGLAKRRASEPSSGTSRHWAPIAPQISPSPSSSGNGT